jgi:hypothetical protein
LSFRLIGSLNGEPAGTTGDLALVAVGNAVVAGAREPELAAHGVEALLVEGPWPCSSRLDEDLRFSSAGGRRQNDVVGATRDLYVVASCGVLVAGTLQPHVTAHATEGLIVEG